MKIKTIIFFSIFTLAIYAICNFDFSIFKYKFFKKDITLSVDNSFKEDNSSLTKRLNFYLKSYSKKKFVASKSDSFQDVIDKKYDLAIVKQLDYVNYILDGNYRPNYMYLSPVTIDQEGNSFALVGRYAFVNGHINSLEHFLRSWYSTPLPQYCDLYESMTYIESENIKNEILKAAVHNGKNIDDIKSDLRMGFGLQFNILNYIFENRHFENIDYSKHIHKMNDYVYEYKFDFAPGVDRIEGQLLNELLLKTIDLYKDIDLKHYVLHITFKDPSEKEKDLDSYKKLLASRTKMIVEWFEVNGLKIENHNIVVDFSKTNSSTIARLKRIPR